MRFSLFFSFLLISFSIPVHAEQMRSLDYETAAPPPALYNTKEQTEQPSEKAWERYKALAAGQPQQEEVPMIEQKPQEPQKPTGFSHLLQQYQANKKGRAGMRSIDVD